MDRDDSLPCRLCWQEGRRRQKETERSQRTKKQWGEERWDRAVLRDVRAQGPPLVIKSRIFHTVSHKNHIYLVVYLRPTACHPVPPLRQRGRGAIVVVVVVFFFFFFFFFSFNLKLAAVTAGQSNCLASLNLLQSRNSLFA